MANEIKIGVGGVTAPQGFKAGATYAGIKRPGPGKRDIGLLVSNTPCTVAATFTTNAVVSPTLILNRQILENGAPIRAVVASSGCANTSVGEQGLYDAKEMASLAASRLRLEATQVLVATTGLIGVELPMNLIRDHLSKVSCTSAGGAEFTRSIMTTDTEIKQCATEIQLEGKKITIGGTAKGSGMIHPNMATLLAFITTDANLEPQFLNSIFKQIVKDTFNQLDIDGDQSPNDMAVVLANAAAANPVIKGDSTAGETFRQALSEVCRTLVKLLATDGEGARKLITAVVEGAATLQEAQRGARAIVSSALVKTAIYGRDPNWGRFVAALGSSGLTIDEHRLQMFINGIQIVEHGIAIPFNAQSIVSSLAQPEVTLLANLNLGEARGEAWGCELSEEYVIFNSAYTT